MSAAPNSYQHPQARRLSTWAGSRLSTLGPSYSTTNRGGEITREDIEMGTGLRGTPYNTRTRISAARRTAIDDLERRLRDVRDCLPKPKKVGKVVAVLALLSGVGSAIWGTDKYFKDRTATREREKNDAQRKADDVIKDRGWQEGVRWSAEHIEEVYKNLPKETVTETKTITVTATPGAAPTDPALISVRWNADADGEESAVEDLYRSIRGFTDTDDEAWAHVSRLVARIEATATVTAAAEAEATTPGADSAETAEGFTITP